MRVDGLEYPWVLGVGIAVVLGVLLWRFVFRRGRLPSVSYFYFPLGVRTLQASRKRWLGWRAFAVVFYRWALVGAVLLVVVALARPYQRYSAQHTYTEGVDIMIVLDISTSMLAEDLKPNRLEAAKRVALEFARGRPADRVGLVVFAAEAVALVPPTFDRRVLEEWLPKVKSEMLMDGTAIGMGLAVALARLHTSTAKSKTILLVTDGENNTGIIDPVSAAQIARSLGVRIYTVGVGTYGTAPYPVRTPFGVNYQQVEVRINEGLLREIAQLTGGRYWRATSASVLTEVFAEIDRLEKSRLERLSFERRVPVVMPFLGASIVLIVVGVVVRVLFAPLTL